MVQVAIPKKGTGKCAGDRDPTRMIERECNNHECPKYLVCESKVDLIIAIDGSGSVKRKGWDAEVKFVHAMLDRTYLIQVTVRKQDFSVISWQRGE